MNSRFDVLIVGAGMVGAALACALGDSRLKVGVIDARAPVIPASDDYDLRVSAITLASRALFENVGAWGAMQNRRVSPVEAMHVWEQGGEIKFDAAEIGEACLAYIVENSVIQLSLIERLHAFTNVHCLWPVEIDSVALDDTGATVVLKDGRRLAASLLVGADGAESAIRRAAGIDAHQLDVEQKAIVATVRTEIPHARVARQRFLSTGPLAFLPLSDANTCSIVWSADTARAESLMSRDEAAFVAELHAEFGDVLGKIIAVGRRQSFALGLAHATSYIATRVALIGDAAHTVHPLAGQGVNMGLLDAATLAGLVLEASSAGRDIGARQLLRRYERARKGENLGMVTLTGGFRYLFGGSSSIASRLRNAGLDLANAVTPLKRSIMRHASGLAGDLPALARVQKP